MARALATLLLLTTAGCAKKDDATPPPPVAAPASPVPAVPTVPAVPAGPPTGAAAVAAARTWLEALQRGDVAAMMNASQTPFHLSIWNITPKPTCAISELADARALEQAIRCMIAVGEIHEILATPELAIDLDVVDGATVWQNNHWPLTWASDHRAGDARLAGPSSSSYLEVKLATRMVDGAVKVDGVSLKSEVEEGD